MDYQIRPDTDQREASPFVSAVNDSVNDSVCACSIRVTAACNSSDWLDLTILHHWD